MNNILLVAAREFRQIAGTRSFWLTLLLMPIAMAVGPLAQRYMSKDEPDRVMVIDRNGGAEARAIADQVVRIQGGVVVASGSPAEVFPEELRLGEGLAR